MKCTILYFSRTGVGKRIAEKLALQLGANTVEIQDDKNWSGVLGYIKAGFYASTNKSVNISIKGDYKDADHYVVISPIWAGGPACAVREFLKLVDPVKTSLVLNCLGSDPDAAYDKFEKMTSHSYKRYGIVKRLQNEDIVINQLVKQLKG